MAIKKRNNSAARKWKEIWHSTNVYEAIVPLYMTSKILGIAPFTITKGNGEQRCELSKLGTLYSILFLISYVAFFIYANADANKVSVVEIRETSRVARFIDSFNWFVNVSILIGVIAANCYHQKTVVEAFNQLDFIDKNMKNFGLKLHYSSTKMRVAGQVVFQILLFLVMEQINCSLFLKEMKITSYICHTVCYIPLMIFALLKSQYSILVILLRYRFEAINDKLRTRTGTLKYYQKPSSKVQPVQIVQFSSSQHILSVTRKLHGQLCNIGCLVSKAYSLQIVLLIGCNFISFTAHAYFCLESYTRLYIRKESVGYDLITTTLWGFLKLGTLLHLTYTCNQTTDEARETGVIIHKIRDRFECSVLDEVAAFSKQIIHWDFKFTAFDLFNIDMAAFYGMVASAATYLMILIQMDVAVNKNVIFSSSNLSFRSIG